MFGRSVPDDLRITELGGADGDDGVFGVFVEGEAVIERVGNFLRLLFVRVESVHGDDTILLVGEEAGGVVDVDDARAGEDGFTLSTREDGYGLVDPGIEIFGGSVTPVLVAGYNARRIV